MMIKNLSQDDIVEVLSESFSLLKDCMRCVLAYYWWMNVVVMMLTDAGKLILLFVVLQHDTLDVFDASFFDRLILSWKWTSPLQ